MTAPLMCDAVGRGGENRRENGLSADRQICLIVIAEKRPIRLSGERTASVLSSGGRLVFT